MVQWCRRNIEVNFTFGCQNSNACYTVSNSNVLWCCQSRMAHKYGSGLGCCGHADLPVRKPVNGRDCLALAVLQVGEGLIL